MIPEKGWSRAKQATTEGGLFGLGMTLITAGIALFQSGETLTGAIACIAGGVLIIAGRYVKIPA